VARGPASRRAACALAVGLLAAGPVLALLGCATPSGRAAREARGLGLVREEVAGAGFQHVVYRRPGDPASLDLHVYLEGDGSPARAWRSRPPDPTPRSSLALRLLARDPAPSVLLGRPCYHGVGPCSPWHWSAGRFGEPVVASLVVALRTLLATHGAERLTLIGHSGGGTLAMLLAERVPEVRAVVTVAGNLDVGAWVRHHGHVPLAGSLDPALRPPLRPSVAQLHLLGGSDAVVPPALVRSSLERQEGARVRIVPGFDHRCCWAERWPALLAALPAAGAEPRD